MARLTHGHNFRDGDRVTPASLNALINNATLSEVTAADLGAGLIFYTYSNTDPGATLARVWFDTTAGSEGLKTTYASPSNASVTVWLYQLPYRETICWTKTAVSMGTPLFVIRRGGAANEFNRSPGGRHFEEFDGGLFPYVWAHAGAASATGPTPLMVIAMESKAADNPVRCAYAGMVPVFSYGSATSIGNPLFVDLTQSDRWKKTSVTARSMVFGLALHAAGPTSFNTSGFLVWGAGPAMQDIVG